MTLERRRILHINVTAHPYAAWVAEQIIEALGLDSNVGGWTRFVESCSIT